MKKIPLLLSPGECDELLSSISYSKYRFMIMIMYALALRVGELVTIRLDNINLSSRSIKIHGKGAKDRMLPLTARQCLLLSTYTEKYHPVLFLFENAAHNAFTTRGVRNIVYDASIAAFGHRSVHPHSLRHARATSMVNTQTDLRRMQLILGHESIDTTQKYLHFAVDDLRKCLPDV